MGVVETIFGVVVGAALALGGVVLLIKKYSPRS